jgi:MOSC domain-containing protein YiiM
MELISLQVGLPQSRTDGLEGGKPWESGIFKSPVSGPLWLDEINLKGDGQADLENHGGPEKAVLMYSADHYPYWRDKLNLPDFPYGAFGENFTVTGLNEETVFIGDVFRVGGVVVQVTQPRFPCWKLARRWKLRTLTAQVQREAKGGWYVRVLQQGFVEAGQLVERIESGCEDWPVQRVFRLIYELEDRLDEAQELLACEPAAGFLKRVIAQHLE